MGVGAFVLRILCSATLLPLHTDHCLLMASFHLLFLIKFAVHYVDKKMKRISMVFLICQIITHLN